MPLIIAFTLAIPILSVGAEAGLLSDCTSLLNNIPLVQTKFEKNLLTKHDEIIQINELLSEDGYAEAVFRVQTKKGERILKIYDVSRRSLLIPFMIQNDLAQHNIAPKITGMLSKSETTKMVSAHTKITEVMKTKKYRFSILMDRIDIKLHISMNSTGRQIPLGVDRAKLKRKLDKIETVMSNLNIFPGDDLQAVISQDGDLYLIDFDLYYYVTNDEKVYGADYPRGERSFTEHINYHERNWGHMPWRNRISIKSDGSLLVDLFRLRSALSLYPGMHPD